MIRDTESDGLVDFAVGVAAFQFVVGAAFSALTLWVDRPFESRRTDALVCLALCLGVAAFALSFLLRFNSGRLLQAGAYALATLALGAAAVLALADSIPGALVTGWLVVVCASAARAYVSPEVRRWAGGTRRTRS